VNSKELQLKPGDKTGFVYRQKFLPRVVYITFFFLLMTLILQFITPIKIFGSYDGVFNFASCVVGTLIGTYVATFVLKSGRVIDEKSDDFGDLVSETIDKGKEIIDDLTSKLENEENKINEDSITKEAEPKEENKSARERLRDKGFLK
jgi:hypothetical protein